jgi:predicted transcriptional regulator
MRLKTYTRVGNLLESDNRIMATAKEQITQLVQQQPDDSSYDEIIRELAFHRMIERGLNDSDNGRTISNEEMEARINTWLE